MSDDKWNGFFIGLLVGGVFTILCVLILISNIGVLVPEYAADEVCVRLYGEGTEYNDGNIGMEDFFSCKNTVSEVKDESFVRLVG